MNIRSWITRKRVIWGVIIIIVAGLISLRVFGGGGGGGLQTDVVKSQDLKQTVLATGQVTSNTDLNLSFKTSGVVRRIGVKVGDEVKPGQLLANLDQKDLVAALTSARGALASAQANYQKVLDGASSEEVAVAQRTVDAAQVALDNAKVQYNLSVENAYRTLLNTSLAAEAASSVSAGDVTISGTYTGSEEGVYYLKVYQTGAGIYYTATGLGTVSAPILFNVPVPIGHGLYATFVDYDELDVNGSWTVAVPNTKSASYVTNYNAYQTAIKNRDAAIAAAQASLDSAIASLNLKKAQARPADIKAAQAAVLSAQGQVQSALAAIESTEIRAPSKGTVTKVDIKLGQLAAALTSAVVVQDVGNLYLEANVSEANIANLKTGQAVEVTFDALGPDKKYSAVVQTVDPASTVISGVVNYKVKASLNEHEPEIKPGMTANMTILTGEKAGILAVPLRSVINSGGKKYVRVVTNPKKKTYAEQEVTTGFEGDGGLVEIVSGLSAGQEIITYINKK